MENVVKDILKKINSTHYRYEDNKIVHNQSVVFALTDELLKIVKELKSRNIEYTIDNDFNITL